MSDFVVDVSIAFGLLAALCWGISDFVAKLSADKIGAVRTALFLQYIGGFFMFLIAFSELSRFWQFPTAAFMTLGIGLINSAAALSLFKGFEVGRVSIISPICSSYPALSTILAVLLLNERVSVVGFVGIISILTGIILVSLQKQGKLLDRKSVAAGVGYALVAFVSLGFMFFALKLVVGELGILLPLLIIRLVSATVLTGIVVGTHTIRSSFHLRGALLLVFVIGVVDTLGNILYNLGISVGSVSVVSTISGLFSAVTVLLALAMLKERLAVHQAVGLLTILAGVFIIGYFNA